MSLSSGRDQADGLRRILAGQAARHLTFLSAVPAAQKNAVLLNLAAALVRAGNSVQLLDLSLSAQGISSCARPALACSLCDVALQGHAPEHAMREHAQGIRLARLSTQALRQLIDQGADLSGLSRLLGEVSPDANFWLQDADIDEDSPFVLPELSAGEVIVLVSNTPTSIKNAYAQMKEFHRQFGRQPFHLLVLGVSTAQAQMIEKNMALAVNRYLSSKLIALGSIPADEHLSRSMQLGRSIVDAFPMAQAAVAFRELAARLINARAGAPAPHKRPERTLSAALEV